MKALKIVGVGVVIVVVLLFVATLFLGPIVKGAVESAGPKMAQVPMELKKADISVFTGKTRLEGLLIGNPEGFKTPHAIKLANFSMDMSVPSVLSDKILIREIVIDGPEITYEMSLSGSNLKRIQKNLAGEKGEEEPAPESPEPADGGGKKVQIDDLVIKNGMIRVSSGAMRGKAVTVPLPTIHLQGIGKEKEGASVVEVTSRVMGAVVNGVVSAVSASGKLIGDGAKALGSAGVDGAKALGSAGAAGAKAGTDAVTDAADAGKDAVVKGAGAAAEGTKAAGKAVGKGASKLVGGVGKLMGVGKKDKEEAQTEEQE